jgi:hypothetical protein
VKFILTDTRSYKTLETDPDDAAKTMMGFAQEAWIAQELADKAYPVKVICLDTPWVAAATAGEDNWGGYQAAAQRLVNAVKAAGANVFIIHGDAHMLGADNGTSVNNPGGFPVAAAAPFGNSTAVKGGPYSQGTYIGSTTMHGLLDITDDGSTISIRYSGRDGGNVERVTLTSSWSSLTGSLSRTGFGTLTLTAAFDSLARSGSGTLRLLGTVEGTNSTASLITDGTSEAIMAAAGGFPIVVTDDFSALRPDFWTYTGGVTVDGQVHIPSTGTYSQAVRGVGSYDMRGGKATVRLVQADPRAGAETEFLLTDPTAQETRRAFFDVDSGVLTAYYRADSTSSVVAGSAPYNPATHAWLSLGLSAAGVVIWATSPDGVAWTTLATWTATWTPIPPLRPNLDAGFWQGSSALPAIFDNFTLTTAYAPGGVATVDLEPYDGDAIPTVVGGYATAILTT